MPVRRRRSTALAAAVATAAALGATALATVGTTTASAAEMPLKDYELTWGIKQSYRTYVGMFGGFTTADGASQAAGNGAFTFVDGAGTYDTTGHTVELAFKGSLVSASKAHGFEVTLTDLRFDSKAGEITADVKKVDTSQGAPTTTEGDDVPLASVAVTRDMKEMATTLTAEAGEFLGSPGYAGAAGDPLTVAEKTPPTTPTASPSPTEEPQSPEPSPSATETTDATPTAPPKTETPAPDPTPSRTNGTGPSPSASAKGEIADGTLGWGVKQSFRSYVTGPVAKGKITVSAGAVQAAGNGAFTFKDATGTYDTDAGRLTAAFRGAVNFKGHETNGTYGLDLTLSNVEATLDGGTGKLTADVNSLGTRTKGVVLADLKAKSADLTARDDVITVDGVAATLTEAGAKAFGDFYTAGTALDAVDLSVALSEEARLPSGGGTGGSGGSGTTGGTGGGTGSTAGGTGSTIGGTGSTTGGSAIGGGSLASTGSDIPGPALAGAAGIAVALGAGAVFAARRRRTQP
ncbi:HtaA domain-containing protein [Streptomyces sp. M92]|uniref:HtaA domain-containing protein n=1 Tax=Streptomyces sp. M92 TaxID=2944250 RepID=UPI00234B0768|nr:HtaA domain-containing protein [Streptomyces sp. M92]WCN01009.1 HtaA domain-containing protein [Streptomyces sp. M92]